MVIKTLWKDDIMDSIKKYKIGLRTIKTGLAVGLSLYIASLFNLKSPIFVGIGAIMTMQSSVSESFKTGKDRMLGTFVGALVGLIFSYLMPNNYLFLTIGTIIVIYIHIVFDWKSSLTLSAIVFLAIFLNNEGARLEYATNRLLDTFIGISISVIINYFIAAPNVKKTFLDAKLHILKICKDLVYNLVTNSEEITLEDFTKELSDIDKTYSLYKQELEMNVAKSKISTSSVHILSSFDDIYYDLLTILKLNMKANLNEVNAILFKEIYSKDIISTTNDNNPLEVVYNYHLSNILTNLIKIDNLLNEGPRN